MIEIFDDKVILADGSVLTSTNDAALFGELVLFDFDKTDVTKETLVLKNESTYTFSINGHLVKCILTPFVNTDDVSIYLDDEEVLKTKGEIINIFGDDDYNEDDMPELEPIDSLDFMKYYQKVLTTAQSYTDGAVAEAADNSGFTIETLRELLDNSVVGKYDCELEVRLEDRLVNGKVMLMPVAFNKPLFDSSIRMGMNYFPDLLFANDFGPGKTWTICKKEEEDGQ